MLDKLSIARKIAISFSVLLLQLLLVAGGGYIGLQIVGGLFVDYREAANATIAINQISDQLTSLQQIEVQYRFRPEAAQVASFDEVGNAIAGDIEKQRAIFATEPDAQESLTAISAQLAAFADLFAGSVAIQEERSTILATMEQHATSSRNALQDVLSAATTANHIPSVVKASSGSEAILKMLLLAEAYVRTGDPADFEKIPSLAIWAEQVIKGLAPLLKMSLPEATERGTVALAEIAPYLEAARALKVSTERRNAVWAEIDVLGPAMSEVLNGLKRGVAERQSGMGAAADATRANLSLVVLTVGVLSILVGAVLALRIGGGLSQSIRRMAADMQRIAQGELDVAVDAKHSSGELGLMAGALEVFKVNGEAVRSAADERAAVALAEARRLQTQSALQAEVARVVDAAVAGDFSERIVGRFEAPDLQRLAERINRLMQTVDEGVSETAAVMSAFSRSDLTRRMDGQFEGAFADLQRDINLAAETFSGIVGHIQAISRALKSATGEILAGANDLSERTTRQSATIEETSAAIETMAQQITLSAGQAEKASVKSDHAVALADEGGQAVLAATHAMGKISDSSMQISGIIALIDDIAFQTNLLALNASVEAARAGEAGKGFAVVAVEVRRLAQSAAEASAQVKALIEQSVSDVNRGGHLVAEAERKLQQILDAVRENGGYMRSIAAESRSQAVAVRDISSAVAFIDEMTQHNAALVEETNAAIEQTETQASELDEIVRTFVLDGTARELAA